MDFDFTDDQATLRHELRKFLDEEIRPVGVEYGDRTLPRGLLGGLYRKLRPFGYMHEGADFVTSALLTEELSRVFPSLMGVMMISGICARYIERAGPRALRERALEPLRAGEKFGCMAVTEPNVGSDPSAVEARAVLTGDRYVLSGHKRWISNGELSDYAVVLCRTTAGGEEGITTLLVEREHSPYEARDLPKLGMKAFQTSELLFRDCEVPRENCLEEGGAGGLQVLFQDLEWSRCSMALIAVGIAQASLESAVAHARRRRQFGKRIGELQLVQNLIAEMATEIDAARLLSYRAAHLVQRRIRCTREVSMAKAYATEMAVRVASKALQIHGANGLAPENLVERHFRDARTLTIPEGTTEIHKLIIARSVLGLSAFA